MLNYILSLLPSILHVTIRRLLGQKIGKNVKIKFGSFIVAKQISIADNVSIGPFTYIKAENLSIDTNSIVKSFVVISAKKISIHKYVHISPLAMISGDWSPNSNFEIGDHSRVFPFCWLDTGEGIKIGKQVGIGGHTLIFTHGVWSNYLEGGPVTFAGVEIEDNVWLPWRVFIMPGVKIGAWSIFGANSVVNKSVPNNSLVAGSPAKILSQDFIKHQTSEEINKRAEKILYDFAMYDYKNKWKIEDCKITLKKFSITLNDTHTNQDSLNFITDESSIRQEDAIQMANRGNVIYHPSKTAYIKDPNQHTQNFISFLRRYGVRLYINQWR